MAIGAIGNAIFVNQMTASVSSVQNAHDNRVNFQNMVAQATVQEKEAEVLEVRPTEENQEVDPDREHQKNEADQESTRVEHDEDEKKEEESRTSTFKLDIRV